MLDKKRPYVSQLVNVTELKQWNQRNSLSGIIETWANISPPEDVVIWPRVWRGWIEMEVLFVTIRALLTANRRNLIR